MSDAQELRVPYYNIDGETIGYVVSRNGEVLRLDPIEKSGHIVGYGTVLRAKFDEPMNVPIKKGGLIEIVGPSEYDFAFQVRVLTRATDPKWLDPREGIFSVHRTGLGEVGDTYFEIVQ